MKSLLRTIILVTTTFIASTGCTTSRDDSPVFTTTFSTVDTTTVGLTTLETAEAVTSTSIESKTTEMTEILTTTSIDLTTIEITETVTAKFLPSKEEETPTRVKLDVKNIQQLPELPAGCEITSTTIALNYLGFEVDKMDLMKHMPMMKVPDENNRWASPWDVFVGSPEYTYYGCYSPVVKKTVESYFEENEIMGYEIVDLSKSSVYELFEQIDVGYPVIVWATIKMNPSRSGNSWTLQDGTPYTWVAREHCLVLIGYDLDTDNVILSDPYDSRGTVEYSIPTFETRYTELFQQALVIKPAE